MALLLHTPWPAGSPSMASVFTFLSVLVHIPIASLLFHNPYITPVNYCYYITPVNVNLILPNVNHGIRVYKTRVGR